MSARPPWAALLGLLLALVGCAPAAVGPRQAPAPTSATGPPPVAERFIPGVPDELRVRCPRDARGIPPCALLTRAQLVELGFDPDSARSEESADGGYCNWALTDASTSGGVTISTEPDDTKPPDLYLVRTTFARFEIRQIAGHPAIRGDEEPTGECSLFVAAADEQVFEVEGYLDRRVLPDPCATALRMAELILAGLPPLR